MITLLTREDLITDLQAYLSALCPGLSLSKDTDAGARIESLADAIIGLQSEIVSVETDLFPQDCSDEALIKHAEAKFGPNPLKPATKATGLMGVVPFGTPDTLISAGTTLIHENGTRYITTSDTTLNSFGGGTCDVESIDTGTSCNLDYNEELIWESPPAGVSATATVSGYMISGATDEETLAELRVRLLDAIRNPAAGGRFSDYRQWALAVPGVSAAYVYGPSSSALTGRRGLGYIDVAILTSGTGDERIPTAAIQTDVEDYIEPLRPCTTRDVAVLIPAAVDQDIDVQITPEAGYEFDWSTASAWTVSAWDSALKRITWNADLPSGLVAGDRIFVNGQVATVHYISGSTTTDMVEDDLTMASPNPIYPAGPLSQSVLDAIKDYMDTLGPARGVANDPNQVWDSTCRLSKLTRTIMNVAGVEDCTIVTPTTDVTPTDHAPSGAVDILVYDLITVRP